jgi:hypothetical protein
LYLLAVSFILIPLSSVALTGKHALPATGLVFSDEYDAKSIQKFCILQYLFDYY